MLTKTRWFNSIIDCESNTEDKLDTDHYPVIATMNVKFKANRKHANNTMTRYTQADKNKNTY